jgi:hypothetical protein
MQIDFVSRTLQQVIEPPQDALANCVLHRATLAVWKAEAPSKSNVPTNQMKRTMTGRELSEKWKIGAQQTLYRKSGNWFHLLDQFPGALCDANGYILFRTRQDYEECEFLQRGKELGVPGGIESIPGYVRMTSEVPREQEMSLTDLEAIIAEIGRGAARHRMAICKQSGPKSKASESQDPSLLTGFLGRYAWARVEQHMSSTTAAARSCNSTSDSSLARKRSGTEWPFRLSQAGANRGRNCPAS